MIPVLVTQVVAVVDATKYQNEVYQSELKRTHFDVWYRGLKAVSFLLVHSKALIETNNKFFLDNPGYKEGVICGKRKRNGPI